MALAEDKPLPALHSSADVRPLNMDDFKFAHEQVGVKTFVFVIISGSSCPMCITDMFILVLFKPVEIHCLSITSVTDLACHNNGSCNLSYETAIDVLNSLTALHGFHCTFSV